MLLHDLKHVKATSINQPDIKLRNVNNVYYILTEIKPGNISPPQKTWQKKKKNAHTHTWM